MIWVGIVWEAIADVNYEVVVTTKLGWSDLAVEMDAPRRPDVVNGRPQGSDTDHSLEVGMLQ